MTKQEICDKISIMKTKALPIFILSVLILLFSAYAVAFSSTSATFATTPVSGETLLPVSEVETFALDSPQSVSYDDGNYAVIHGSNRIMTYIDGVISDITLKLANSDLGKPTIPTQIRIYGKEIFFVSDNRICRLVGSDGDYSALKDIKGEDIRCIFYDISDNYLIANTTGSSIKVYSITESDTDGSLIFEMIQNKEKLQIDENKPIAIYGDKIFAIGPSPSNYPLYYNISLSSMNELCQSSVNAVAMIADSDYLYYIESGGVFKIHVNGGEKINVTPSCENFDLGKLIAPSGLSFKKGNLLISDSSLDAVQEFTADENGTLQFTGFAIASGKTAYNRIGTAIDSDRYGNRMAVLSDKKLTVITLNELFNGYNPLSFENLFINKDATCFALGKNTVVIAIPDGLFIKKLGSDLPEEKLQLDDIGEVIDVSYQSGYYYALAFDGLRYTYYKISETTGTCVKEGERTEAANCIAADVFGNILITNEDDGFIKIAYDLKTAFGLKTDGKLYYLDTNGKWQQTGLENLSSFALSFDKKEVYYTTESERLYKTLSLDNIAIDSIVAPSDYKLNGTSATLVGNTYKIYSVKENQSNVNVYGFTIKDGSLTFTDFVDAEEEYVYISRDTLSNLYFLAGRNGPVLISGAQLDAESRELEDIDKDVYVTTGVHAYYYPIMTKPNPTIYSLIDGENEVTFKKNVDIYAFKKITVLGRSFYYAEKKTENGDIINFFIPTDFTVDTLSSDLKHVDYTLERVKATAVYFDEELSDKIADLSAETQVRLISKNKDVCKIVYYSDGAWTEGYIKESSIINDSTTAIRNVLIVLALITCVCGSATYFILRRKQVE